MAELEYRTLTPNNKLEKDNKYIEALEWALKNERIKNIALTGPYGSGKSSIIESFLALDLLKNNHTSKSLIGTIVNSIKTFVKYRICNDNWTNEVTLRISMATFIESHKIDALERNETDDSEAKQENKKDYRNEDLLNKIKIDSSKVEEGILKQLFYKVKPDKIPLSRYRKLHKISFWGFRFFAMSFKFLVAEGLITLLLSIFKPDIFYQIKVSLSTFASQFSLGTNPWLIGIPLAVMIAMLLSYFRLLLTPKFKIIEVKLPGTTTIKADDHSEESVFNKNLDEITYFFEQTGYRIVFFEDLDRLDDPKIFVHLRELNNLLNNDDSITDKPIVFIYAVRDDIFTETDRTKFFDFIIPVIPVINSTNSGETLFKMLRESKNKGNEHNISDGFVLDVSPFISDMRILLNSYNEFLIYKASLSTGQGLALKDENMLAIVIFKNLYPHDFADIQNEKGIIKQAFINKVEFINKKKSELQQEINEYENERAQVQNDVCKSIEELKYAMFGTLMGESGAFEGFSQSDGWSPMISVDKVLSKDYDLNNLLRSKAGAIKFYDYNNGRGSVWKPCNQDVIAKYVSRWNALKKKEDLESLELRKKNQSLREQLLNISVLSFVQLCEQYPSAPDLFKNLNDNKLLIFLLRRGYIDETYANYINYFKGESLTKDDMNFILSVKNQDDPDFYYPLTRVHTVVNHLQNYEFELKSIYNFDLLKQLLDEDDAGSKLQRFIHQLSDGEGLSWKFIDEFADRVKPQEKLEKFIKLLSENWTGMWKKIASDASLTYDRQLFYLRLLIALTDSDTVKALNEDGCITIFFEAHSDILKQLSNSEPARLKSWIDILDVHFVSLQTESVPEEILSYVFDNNHYVLNDEMLRTILSYKDPKIADRFDKAPYSAIVSLDYPELTRYVTDNIVSFVKEIVLEHQQVSDQPENVVQLLDKIKSDAELAANLLNHEDVHFKDIAECGGNQIDEEHEFWLSIWSMLLKQNKVDTIWSNVLTYWHKADLNEQLAEYIEIHSDELANADTSEVDDDFIKKLLNYNFDLSIFKKLLPVLRLKEFDIDISTLNEALLPIMVECHYFEFTVNRYNQLVSMDEELAYRFIILNQAEFTEQIGNIPLDENLFEKLILDKDFLSEYKVHWFENYAPNYLTAKVAIQMGNLNMPVTKEIFDKAWQLVDKSQKTKLMLQNYKLLNCDELENYFADMDKSYSELANRTNHLVRLKNTEENKNLSRFLKNIGYITSFDTDTERKLIKVRVKAQKA
ncbi:hypothetical protein [uncultured Megasphaera sp.]|jgi:hypothetical protein|uniref:YobI family P-loop NTPase n=1 Tax=uncultured Megasphaera sp. TaxID=165188 RepID=UPI00258CA2E9|nr:hypothetical protein [uncultured Megasphaera sp.]